MTDLAPRTKAKRYFLLLTLIFLCAQIFILSDEEVLAEDIPGVVLFSVVFLIFIGLTIKGYKWAKWILTVMLILFGSLFLFAGFEIPSLNFKLVGFYYYFFGIIPHLSRRLKPISIVKPKLEIVNDEQTVTSRKETFPYLIDRYKAMLIDTLLLLGFLTICLLINSEMQYNSTWIVVIYFTLALSYEPILVAYSQTIGQKVMKIRVRNSNEPEKNISLWQSYIRFFVKILLGWLSFITISFNIQKRAIHDMASSSIVIDYNKDYTS